MARIVNSTLIASTGTTLTADQRRKAVRQLAKRAKANPLRVVRIECHGPVRDPDAIVGDWIWCDKCSDNARVISVRE